MTSPQKNVYAVIEDNINNAQLLTELELTAVSAINELISRREGVNSNNYKEINKLRQEKATEELIDAVFQNTNIDISTPETMALSLKNYPTIYIENINNMIYWGFFLTLLKLLNPDNIKESGMDYCGFKLNLDLFPPINESVAKMKKSLIKMVMAETYDMEDSYYLKRTICEIENISGINEFLRLMKTMAMPLEFIMNFTTEHIFTGYKIIFDAKAVLWGEYLKFYKTSVDISILYKMRIITGNTSVMLLS